MNDPLSSQFHSGNDGKVLAFFGLFWAGQSKDPRNLAKLGSFCQILSYCKKHHHHWGGSKLMADKIRSVCLRHQQDDSPKTMFFHHHWWMRMTLSNKKHVQPSVTSVRSLKKECDPESRNNTVVLRISGPWSGSGIFLYITYNIYGGVRLIYDKICVHRWTIGA